MAGILRDRMVFNMTEQEWDDVIRVHLKGTFNTTKFASAHWRSLRDSSAQNRIINFTSVSGLHGAPGQPNYAAAKMGIVGLTYSSANALAKYGVTVNAISPGAATRMTDSMPDVRRRARPGADERSPDNVAPIVAYLAAERSGWITGRIIHTSGYEVALYSNPEPVIRIVGTGPWPADAPRRAGGAILRPAARPGRARKLEVILQPIRGRPRASKPPPAAPRRSPGPDPSPEPGARPDPAPALNPRPNLAPARTRRRPQTLARTWAPARTRRRPHNSPLAPSSPCRALTPPAWALKFQ